MKIEPGQMKLDHFTEGEKPKVEQKPVIFEGQLPNGWRWVKLGSVAEIIMGQSPPSETYNEDGVGLPFYQGKADFGVFFPTPRKWCSKPLKIALPNDILISVRAPVGPVNFCREKSCIGRGLAAIRLTTEIVPMYAFFYLRFKEQELMELGKGSTFGAIKRKDLENVLIPLPFRDGKPDIEEQRRVVARVEELTSRIEQAKKLREEALKETEKIMQTALHQTFKKVEHYGFKTLSDVCIINPSKKEVRNLPEDMDVSFVPMSAVNEVTGEIENPSVKKLKDVRKGYTYFKQGDVIFAKITPCMENGKSAIAKNLVNGIGFGSTEFHVLRPSNEVTPEWIFYFIRQKSFRELAARFMTGSVGQQRVPEEFLQNARIPVPPIPLQISLTDHLNKIKRKIESLLEHQKIINTYLELLTQTILKKAFTGGL
ncbi:MAG: restriction endonuclease subunit S [Candidatus Bathyarchaeia archaeon]